MSDIFRFSLSADYRKLWSQLWTVKATVCSLGHIGICEYPLRREQSLVNEFVFTVITMFFFFHFSFSGIRNDSSNDLLMAWEQTASGHPCIVFFNWVSSTVIHVYKSILYMIFVISPCLCPTTCVTLMPDPEEFFWTRKSRALSLALQNSAFHCFNKLSSLHCNIWAMVSFLLLLKG